MQASIGQYSMHAGDPAHPVQQSVVMANIRGFFLRVALPSPTDIGQYLSMMSYKLSIPHVVTICWYLCRLRDLRFSVVIRFRKKHNHGVIHEPLGSTLPMKMIV